MIVVDTSLISYLIIPGDWTKEAERVRFLDPDWIAPFLWTSEFRSVLRKYIVAGILPVEEAFRYVDIAEELMRGRSVPVSSKDVLALVATSRCSAYDCEFIALAKLAGVRLVTTDKAVLRAFTETAIHPSDFAV